MKTESQTDTRQFIAHLRQQVAAGRRDLDAAAPRLATAEQGELRELAVRCRELTDEVEALADRLEAALDASDSGPHAATPPFDPTAPFDVAWAPQAKADLAALTDSERAEVRAAVSDLASRAARQRYFKPGSISKVLARFEIVHGVDPEGRSVLVDHVLRVDPKGKRVPQAPPRLRERKRA